MENTGQGKVVLEVSLLRVHHAAPPLACKRGTAARLTYGVKVTYLLVSALALPLSLRGTLTENLLLKNSVAITMFLL